MMLQPIPPSLSLRSVSHVSSLARSTSFSTLAGWKESEETNSVMSETLSMDQSDIAEGCPPLDTAITQQELTPADIEALSRGSHLGLFTKNSKGKAILLQQHQVSSLSPCRATTALLLLGEHKERNPLLVPQQQSQKQERSSRLCSVHHY